MLLFFFPLHVNQNKSDESLCVINKKDASEVSGVPRWGVMLLALFCSGLVFGTAFVYWRNKHKQQMRDEVKAILAEYMPLDDVPSGDQEDVSTRFFFYDFIIALYFLHLVKYTY